MLTEYKVGQKYIRKSTGNVAECTAVCNKTGIAFLLFPNQQLPYSYSKNDLKNLEEYKEPKKLELYCNLYKSVYGSLNYFTYDSRKEADHASCMSRVGCQKITLIEGTWDD